MNYHSVNYHLASGIKKLAAGLLFVSIPIFDLTAQPGLTKKIKLEPSKIISTSFEFISNSSESNIPPTKPILISPADNSNINSNQSIVFKWNKSIDSDPITYDLQILGPIGYHMTYYNIVDTVFTLPENTYSVVGKYIWTVTANDGINSTSADGFSFLANVVTDINNTPEFEIKIYPNPTSGYIYIKNISPSFNNTSYKIYSLNGTLIGLGIIDLSPNDSSINLTELKSGFYYICFDHENLMKVIKVQKQ